MSSYPSYVLDLTVIQTFEDFSAIEGVTSSLVFSAFSRPLDVASPPLDNGGPIVLDDDVEEEESKLYARNVEIKEKGMVALAQCCLIARPLAKKGLSAFARLLTETFRWRRDKQREQKTSDKATKTTFPEKGKSTKAGSSMAHAFPSRWHYKTHVQTLKTVFDLLLVFPGQKFDDVSGGMEGMLKLFMGLLRSLEKEDVRTERKAANEQRLICEGMCKLVLGGEVGEEMMNYVCTRLSPNPFL
jgi:hypothetical protein